MAFITAETRSDLIELSVAMLKQAPSAALLEELIALSVGGGSLADAADHIAKTAAFKAEYPSFQTAEQYAAEIFDNITTGGTVTADIRTAVIELATGMLTSGSVTKAGLALAIAEYLAAPAALLNTDFADIAQSFQNRADAAEYFVVTKELGGSTDAELAAAIASVTSDAATLTAANTAADATASAEAVVAGQTFTLTTGLDTLTGGSNDDTFSAQETLTATTDTLTTGDNLTGGAGTDTLSIAVSGVAPGPVTTAGIATTGIEKVSVYNNSAAAYTVDAALMSGLSDIYVNGGANATSITGVGTLANLHLTSTNVAATLTTTAASGLADAAIILSNYSAQTAPVTATYDGLEVINFVAAGTTGAYSIVGEITGTNRTLTLDSDALEKVVVTGDANASIAVNLIGAALETQISEFDASAAGGSITAEVTKGASATATVTMSAQADHLDFNGALANTITLDGGDGVDTLELDFDLTYSTAAATAGTAQAGAGVSNFEALYLASGTDVDERALTNNAGITSVVAAAGGSYTKSTALASVTQLTTGTFTTTVATDGAADALTLVLPVGGTTSTLSAANVETLTVSSGGVAANAVTMSAAGSADLTSVTVVGTRAVDITVSGTILATVDASGVSGVSTTPFILDASASEADMTVTGSAIRPSVALTGLANTIDTGDGDDTITGGAYSDDINAGAGDNTITAGDGRNVIDAGRGDDTITAGDGNNIIDAGNGDNTVTVGDGTNSITVGTGDDTVTTGGTTTSALVMDVNTVGLDAGDDTFTGGAGRDVVTLGTGDDTVDTGAGADSIYASSFDEDDVVNGGAGTDALSSQVLTDSVTLALTGAQIQPVANYVDLNPGATRTATPQITGVESVYMDVVLDAANLGSVATRETVDFSASSGISNLYLDTSVGDTTSVLILNELDAAAIHLTDSVTGGIAGLTVVGTGQASLTIKGHANAGATAITVTETDAVTLTSYVDNATAAVTDSVFGVVTVDEAEGLTVTAAGVANTVGTVAFTTGAISASVLETLTLSAGSNATLTGTTITAGEDLTSIDIDVSEDGTMDFDSITATAGTVEVSTMTIDVGVGGDFGRTVNAGATTLPVVITADSIETATVTVGAAATLRADFTYAGTTTLTAAAGSTVDIDTIGLTGAEASFTISGRATTNAAIAVVGKTTYDFSGMTTTVAQTVTATDASDKTIIGNDLANTINTGAGADSVTGGALIDTISTGTGNDRIIAGAGADLITGGAGADTITTGTGADDITIGATDSLNTALDKITDYTAGTDDLDLVTVPTALVAAAAAGNAGAADLVAAANYASSGATAATLATDIAAIVALQGANAFDDVGDTIVVKLTGASVAGTGVTYVIQNQAANATYDAAADTVIALTGTSTAPTVLADFI